MKLAIHSDLHLEGNSLPKGFGANQAEVDLVVLAGDIGVRGLDKNLADIRAAYPTQPILFCPGNHEYYGYDFQTRREEMAKLCADNDMFFMTADHGFMYYDKENNEDYYFIGSTCWSDMAGATDEEKAEVQRGVADFYKISKDGKPFTVEDMILESFIEKLNIKRILDLSLDEDIYDGKVIVVSHFPPTPKLANPIFQVGAFTKYFHNDWDNLIWRADAWIYGHTHYNSPVVEHDDGRGRHKTKFLTNQRGYNKEPSNAVYDPAYVVELK